MGDWFATICSVILFKILACGLCLVDNILLCSGFDSFFSFIYLNFLLYFVDEKSEN